MVVLLRRHIFILFWFILLSAGANAPIQAAFFSTQGQEILDTTGTPIVLRGVGLGGWLVPEGYMLHIPGFGSPSYIDSLIRALIGPQSADQFWQIYLQNYVQEEDIIQISDWGFNSIRLPFHYKLFYDPLSGQFRPEGFALVDSLLDWCRENGLFVILDMHCAPGGQNKDNISDSDGIEARLWTEPANQELTIRIWKEIAIRYANEKQIIGYDLLNEPVLPPGFSNTVLRNFYQQLSDTIRTVDQNHILFIEGNWYATDFSNLTPPFDNNMVYAFHKYWNVTTVSSIQYLLDIRAQYDVPLWLGESGENSNHWYWSVVQLMENLNIGWCWWTHKKISTITSPLSAPITPEYQVVLNYWNGISGPPSPSLATSALFGMVEHLAIGYCEFHPDVVHALFNPAFGNQGIPYAEHTIPGVIDAVEYDFGSQGIAYSDVDFQNVSGPGGSSWNNGWEFRNDGVDIETCQDAVGADYNVGWIEDGEWLRYTVNITQSGNYTVTCRVATPNSGGRIQLYLDGQPVSSPVAVPQTGGWQQWTNLTIPAIQLPFGLHQLYLSFPSGGFNINRMIFQPITALDAETENIPEKMILMPNYPNPFNAETRIRYYLPRRADVMLEIMDACGKKMMSRKIDSQSTGWHTISVDAREWSSGVYFYRLQSRDEIRVSKMLLVK